MFFKESIKRNNNNKIYIMKNLIKSLIVATAVIFASCSTSSSNGATQSGVN